MKRQKPQIHLPRREFLMKGGAGVLGTIIAAGTLDLVHGAQRPSVENVHCAPPPQCAMPGAMNRRYDECTFDLPPFAATTRS